MYPFDDWPQRISEEKNDWAIQSEIADKILELLEQNKAPLSAREKTIFAQAITGLSVSVNSINQSAEAGLRRCLIALEKAMYPENAPDEPYAIRNNDGELINYAMLVSTVEKLQKQISKKLANIDSRAFVE